METFSGAIDKKDVMHIWVYTAVDDALVKIDDCHVADTFTEDTEDEYYEFNANHHHVCIKENKATGRTGIEITSYMKWEEAFTESGRKATKERTRALVREILRGLDDIKDDIIIRIVGCEINPEIKIMLK